MNGASVSRYFEPFGTKYGSSPSKKVQNLGGLLKEKKESTFVHFFNGMPAPLSPSALRQ